MISTEENIDRISALLRSLRRYGSLRLKSARLTTVEKLGILLSTLLIVVVLIVVFAVAFLFLALAAAHALAPHVGGLQWGFAIVAAVCIALAVLFYALRRRLVVNPSVAFLAHLFLEGMDEEEETTETDEEDEL